MENKLELSNGGRLTASDVIEQVQRIQQVMEAVMKKDVHYGVIPGTDKPTLYKPGAEKIMLTFRIANDTVVDDLSTHDEIRYRVRQKAIHIESGNVLGEGIGEASSSEEKYKWKKSVNAQEWEEAAADRRREKWFKGKQGADYQVKQIRTNPSDVANTILKMGKKRAIVDMVLTVTAASDIFAQDLDEDHLIPDDGSQPVPDSKKYEVKKTEPVKSETGEPADERREPQATPDGIKMSTVPQHKRIYAIYKNKGMTDAQMKGALKSIYGKDHLTELTVSQASAFMEWIEKQELLHA